MRTREELQTMRNFHELGQSQPLPNEGKQTQGLVGAQRLLES